MARKATTSKSIGRDQHLPLLLLHLPHQQEGKWDSLTPTGERGGEKLLAQADAGYSCAVRDHIQPETSADFMGASPFQLKV